MKPSIFKLLFLFHFFLVDSYAQQLVTNTCDSTLLTKEEYQKCKSDGVWTADIFIKTNYIVRLKTELFPKYRLIRRNLDLPNTLHESVQKLKLVYDSVLNKKLRVYEIEMDKNQKFVQPKAYLSSILSFQLFKLYPDVYAILLNDIHLQLIPKTTINQQKTYSQLFDETIKHIPVELHEKLVKITAEFIKDQNKLTEQKIPALFQGSLPEEYRSKCNCLNFLLWTD